MEKEGEEEQDIQREGGREERRHKKRTKWEIGDRLKSQVSEQHPSVLAVCCKAPGGAHTVCQETLQTNESLLIALLPWMPRGHSLASLLASVPGTSYPFCPHPFIPLALPEVESHLEGKKVSPTREKVRMIKWAAEGEKYEDCREAENTVECNSQENSWRATELAVGLNESRNRKGTSSEEKRRWAVFRHSGPKLVEGKYAKKKVLL